MSEDRCLDWVEYTKVNEQVTKATERVVTEFGLSISVNGTIFTTAIITPMMKKEFVIGYLFGQGVIDTVADINSISVNGNRAEVTLSRKKNRENQPLKMNSDLRVKREAIFSGINLILKSELYEETSAIHSAGLFKPGAEPVFIAEDVGRHNALDKVIGYALMNDVDFNHTFAASTGRMVSDMVSKICRANIPIVATKTAVTKLGIEMGEQCGLTIVGFVRDARTKIKTDTGELLTTAREMKIYTNPHRIL